MASFESRLTDWLVAQQASGERPVSWAVLGFPPDSVGGRDQMDLYLDTRGLEPELRFEPWHLQTFIAMTETRVVLGSIGGVLGLKPKELLIEAPLEAVSVEWWDERSPGPDRRHLLVLFGDRWVRTGAIATKRCNIAAFLDALGDRARHIEA